MWNMEKYVRVDKFNNFAFEHSSLPTIFTMDYKSKWKWSGERRSTLDRNQVDREQKMKMVQLKCIMNICPALCAPHNKTYTQITIFRALSVYCRCGWDFPHISLTASLSHTYDPLCIKCRIRSSVRLQYEYYKASDVTSQMSVSIWAVDCASCAH